MKTSIKPRAATLEDHHTALLKMKSAVLLNLGIKFDTIASMGRINEEDQAQYSNDEYLQLRLNALEYRKLRQLEAALDRLHNGDYGSCLGCEESIPPRRLEIIPWARYCVHCQDLIANAETEEEAPSPLSATFA